MNALCPCLTMSAVEASIPRRLRRRTLNWGMPNREVSPLRILYRSVGGENPKSRPPYYSKLLCLRSLLRAASRLPHRPHITFVNDGPMPGDRLADMEKWGEVVSLPGVGNSPSYRGVLKLALRLPPDALVYLAEDDYLYTEHALEKLLGALTELPRADYVSLFDHLDR